jgi:hypothetical protein
MKSQRVENQATLRTYLNPQHQQQQNGMRARDSTGAIFNEGVKMCASQSFLKVQPSSFRGKKKTTCAKRGGFCMCV